MYTITTLNNISQTGLNEFEGKTFKLKEGDTNPDGIILRSASMHEMELGENLLAIARAGAGYNNIPIAKCSETGVVVFNTPGGNANAVKEIIIASLIMASRKLYKGIEWVLTLKDQEDAAVLVEKGKKNFVGPEIMNKTMGVIGLGAVGVQVANACEALGMKVMGFDPHISLDAAWSLSRNVQRAENIDTILKNSDYITIHTPLVDGTRGLFNDKNFAKMKSGSVLLNFSRGEIVINDDVKKAIKDRKIACYVTDFPSNEVIGHEGIIAVPHLGASTPEAEDNCAIMAARQLKDYIENGNIKNSVNFPNCDMGLALKHRLTIINKNVPNVIAAITNLLAEKHINIADMINRSKGDWAYNIIDMDDACPKDIIETIKNIEGVIKVRTIAPTKE